MTAVVVTTEIASPVGPLFAGANDDGVCMLEFSDCDQASQTTATAIGAKNGASGFLDQLAAELADYFAGRLTEFRTPLAVDGTEWQRKVWAELRRIPYGATRSYQDVARAVCSAKGKSFRKALPRACGTQGRWERLPWSWSSVLMR